MIQQVIIPTNLGNEFDLGVIEANKIHVKVDDVTIKRDAITGVISAPAVVSALSIPQPKLEILQGAFHNSLDMDGNQIDSDYVITARLDDIPAIFLTPSYRVRLELLRIKASERKKTNVGYVKKGRRFVHPSNVVAGVATHSHINGTRTGNHLFNVTRITEWDISPLNFFSGIKIPVAEILGSYFFRQKYSDISLGMGIESLAYADGQRNRHYARRKENIQSRGRENGLFAFRYAIFNTVTGRYEQSALSEIVWVAPKHFPTYVSDASLAYRRTVNLNADGKFELVAKFRT